jgi:hypothetical protein
MEKGDGERTEDREGRRRKAEAKVPAQMANNRSGTQKSPRLRPSSDPSRFFVLFLPGTAISD